ncbi:uncharacterized protein LOC123560235 [Mercenaria mercenaria]|uniref:uncharacterized protein LOC123560235 n=1 Tax=Mercenaria mercenaria TaxID=6596 RepID=UPI001E1D9208|nr:uncharacterized protein LOC123560235 [Mercenaria mercenaria]
MNTSTQAIDDLSIVETDNIESISVVIANHAEEEACDKKQILAVGSHEYTIKTPPSIPEVQPPEVLSQRQYALQYPLYQCARVRNDSGSGSDSAKEEEQFTIESKQAIVTTDMGKLFLQQKEKYDDVNVRLSTFIKSSIVWPHTSPSAEQMAAAGMIFKGAFFIKENNRTVYDMVECYICGGRLYEFAETDNPQEEHRRLYPLCS